MQHRNVDFTVQIFFECFSLVVSIIAANVPSIKVVFSFTSPIVVQIQDTIITSTFV